jgi:hypothetical protein
VLNGFRHEHKNISGKTSSSELRGAVEAVGIDGNQTARVGGRCHTRAVTHSSPTHARCTATWGYVRPEKRTVEGHAGTAAVAAKGRSLSQISHELDGRCGTIAPNLDTQ